MNPVYSTYEAKARFSEVMRLVREGTPVTVTYRGDPVAEIRPIEPAAPSIEEHFAALERRGIVIPAEDPRSPLEVGPPSPGALARFLTDRDGNRPARRRSPGRRPLACRHGPVRGARACRDHVL